MRPESWPRIDPSVQLRVPHPPERFKVLAGVRQDKDLAWRERMASGDERGLPTGTVTFLFTDIEGSTRLLHGLGDDYRSILERHSEILRAAINGSGGIEVSTEGDAFFVVFPTAPGAVRAATQMQRRLAAEPWPPGAPIRIRIGLHTGEAVLGGDNYVGLDVNRAARITAAAHGGQVLLSGATAALASTALPDDVGLRDLGPHRLKDLDLPIGIQQLEIGGLDSSFPPIKSLDTAGGNLPRQLTSFVGREAELAAVASLLAESRLLTLTGPGGTGKTRLALAAAHAARDRYADGAWFVDLAPIRAAVLVPLALSRALDIAVDPGGDALQAAANHLRHRETLVVVDNFEQVSEARNVVAELLDAAGRVTWLVTSREPLGLYGEQEFPVPPFAGADAAELFADRARAVRPGFSPSGDDMTTIERIVDHVAGLPLAVELAATQLRVLSPSALLERLEQHLPLPSSAEGGRPERQQTMQRAMAWSHDLLAPAERWLFARLSCLPGGFSLEAAEAVGQRDDGGPPVIDLLSALVRKSLVRATEAADDEPRYRMLEPMLEFAADRLREDGEADDALRRLAGYWLTFAEEAAGHLTGHDQRAWLDRCEREAPNLRRIFDWILDAGEAEIGLRMATGLWRFWQQRGPIQEGRTILERLVDMPGASAAVRGRAHGAAGGLAWWSGDLPATGHHYATARSLLEEGGDLTDEAAGLMYGGFALVWQAVLAGGDADAAEGLFRRSLELAESVDDLRGMARALRGLGFVIGIARDDPAGALPLFERSVALAEQAGDRWEMNESIIGVGNALRFAGDKPAAKRAYLRGIDLMAETGNRMFVIGQVLLLSALEVELGMPDRVVRLWAAAQREREASGAISPPAGARLIGDPVAAARASIGDEATDAGLAEGRAMDYEALLAYAHR